MDALLSRLEDPYQYHALPNAAVPPDKKHEDTMRAPTSLPAKQGTKRKKKVLEEEDYVDTLSQIIERDYFPQLAATRASTASVDAAAAADLTVTSFFEQFTSYDNDSFEVLQQQSQAEHIRKHPWLYELPAIEGDGADAQRQPGMLMLYYLGSNVLSAQQRRRMDAILDGAAGERVGDERRNGVAIGKFRVRNQLMFPPELAASEDTCDMHAPRTGLRAILPAPDASQRLITDGSDTSFNTRSNNLEALHRAVARYNSRISSAPEARHEKAIQRCNTGFRASSSDSTDIGLTLTAAQLLSWRDSNHNQAGQSAGRWKGGLALEEPHTPSLRSSDAESSRSETSSVSDRGHVHSRDRAYLPVPMSPCPVPGEGALGSLTPLFTWGDVEDSPLLLGRQVAEVPIARQGAMLDETDRRRLQAQALREEEGSVPRFSLRPASQREMLARKLDTVSASSKKDYQRKQNKTPLRTGRSGAGDDDSVASTACYYRDSAVSQAGSLTSRRHSSTNNSSSRSSAQRLADLTPAARALAFKLNKGLQRSGL